MILYTHGFIILCVNLYSFVCVLGTPGWLFEGESCYSYSEQDEKNLTGTCVHWQRCLSVANDLRRKINPQLCSYHGIDPIVCCTDCELFNGTSFRNIIVTEFGTYYYKTGSKSADKCLEYSLTLEYPCPRKGGYQRTLHYDKQDCYGYPKVFGAVGGRDATRREYPHMALLGYGNNMDSAQWLCGGTVISERFILTAAHCLASREGPVRFVGLGVLKRSDPPETWQRYTVKTRIPHPEYKAPSKYHDIALLETTTEIKFSRDVLPACLTTGNEDVTKAVATGWGALGYREEVADTLQAVTLQQFSEEICANAFPENRNLLYGYHPATQTCYGDKEKIIDTCPGDSGGPLQVLNEDSICNNLMFNIVIGVTSFGTACGFLGSSGIYTRVIYYKTWIENIVWP